MNPGKSTPRHIIKMTKIKERIPKAREKQTITYIYGKPRKAISSFLAGLYRPEVNGIIKALKEKKKTTKKQKPCNQEYSIQQDYHSELESVPDKQKLKEFTTTKLALQEMLKEIL